MTRNHIRAHFYTVKHVTRGHLSGCLNWIFCEEVTHAMKGHVLNVPLADVLLHNLPMFHTNAQRRLTCIIGRISDNHFRCFLVPTAHWTDIVTCIDHIWEIMNVSYRQSQCVHLWKFPVPWCQRYSFSQTLKRVINGLHSPPLSHVGGVSLVNSLHRVLPLLLRVLIRAGVRTRTMFWRRFHRRTELSHLARDYRAILGRVLFKFAEDTISLVQRSRDIQNVLVGVRARVRDPGGALGLRRRGLVVLLVGVLTGGGAGRPRPVQIAESLCVPIGCFHIGKKYVCLPLRSTCTSNSQVPTLHIYWMAAAPNQRLPPSQEYKFVNSYVALLR